VGCTQLQLQRRRCDDRPDARSCSAATVLSSGSGFGVRNNKNAPVALLPVIPANAGDPGLYRDMALKSLDPRVRGDDDRWDARSSSYSTAVVTIGEMHAAEVLSLY